MAGPRSLDQQLLHVLNRARRDGVFVPWQYVLAAAAVSGTLADNIQPPGIGYLLVEVKDAAGHLVITHEGTIEKRAECHRALPFTPPAESRPPQA